MYYHGTNSKAEFLSLEHNELGLIWVTEDKSAALKYASKYYQDGIKRIFHIKTSGNILDFSDKLNKDVKVIISRIKSKYFFDIESDWVNNAGFGIVESNYWIIDYLKDLGYDGINLVDHIGAYDHSSIALITNNFIIEEIELIQE